MSFATSHRFSFVSFAIAATMTIALNGTMLMGFNQLALNGMHSQTVDVQVSKAKVQTPPVVLERVVITTRRA